MQILLEVVQVFIFVWVDVEKALERVGDWVLGCCMHFGHQSTN